VSASTSVEVRLANTSDLETLVALRLEYIQADLAPLDNEQGRMIADQLRHWIPSSLGERFFAVLASVDAVTASVAMLAVNEYPANPHFPNGRMGTVMNVWTRPAFRRRGLATAVLRELIELGGRLGLSKLELLSSAVAVPLYESQGFSKAQDEHVPMEYSYSASSQWLLRQTQPQTVLDQSHD
jgi:GNAT superfamily N-acetyltransferase